MLQLPRRNFTQAPLLVSTVTDRRLQILDTDFIAFRQICDHHPSTLEGAETHFEFTGRTVTDLNLAPVLVIVRLAGQLNVRSRNPLFLNAQSFQRFKAIR